MNDDASAKMGANTQRIINGIRVIAAYNVREAWQSRFFLLAGLAVVCIGFAGMFVASLTLTDTERFRLSLCGAMLRLTAVFMMASLIVSTTQREINDKIIELQLSLPLPRAALYCGRLLGFSSGAVLLSTLFTLPLFFHADPLAVLFWGIALFFELLIVAAFALWVALSLTQTTSALAATFAFYILARMIGDLQLINGASLAIPGTRQEMIDVLLTTLAALLPRLDQFAHTGWLLGESIALTLSGIVVQGFIYTTLLASAALFDIYRRQW